MPEREVDTTQPSASLLAPAVTTLHQSECRSRRFTAQLDGNSSEKDRTLLEGKNNQQQRQRRNSVSRGVDDADEQMPRSNPTLLSDSQRKRSLSPNLPRSLQRQAKTNAKCSIRQQKLAELDELIDQTDIQDEHIPQAQAEAQVQEQELFDEIAQSLLDTYDSDHHQQGNQLRLS